MRKALVLLPVNDGNLFIRDGWETVFTSPDGVTEKDAEEAEICIGNMPPALIPKAKNLRWLQSSMAGVDAYIPVLPENVLLTNVTGAFGLAISEHIVGYVFELYKKLHLYRDNQNRRQWLDRGKVRSVEGANVLIVGLGDIGESFAKKMKALGANITGVRRKDTEKPDFVDKICLSDELDSELPKADIVALCLPGTPQTKGLFSRERISLMKDGSVLINVGRGSAVDTEALCDALESGKLYGACLDVTDPEPLPPEHRIWGLENAIITPHISGFFHLGKTYENIVSICAENFARYTDGKDVLHKVNRETGYCD